MCPTLTRAVPAPLSPPALLQYGKVTKLTSDAKFEESDVKASIAALSFIFSSAAKHSVDGGSLDNELQQLGLPKGTVTCSCAWNWLGATGKCY